MSSSNIKYLALSHMWGDPKVKHLKLLRSNLSSFQRNIPLKKLSSIYKEAIRVTLALGFNYLWIDSLCIIQDSSADWKYEARLMASVYGNAVCNLAFLFPDGETMPRVREDPRVWNPCLLQPASGTLPGIAVQHYTNDLRRTYQSHETQDWLVQSKWPLFGRAWTFQEYLLSPRTLLLGHKNLMWQCSHGFYDELMGPIAEAPKEWNDETPKKGRDMGKSRYFPSSLQAGLGQCDSVSAPAALTFIIDWQSLINEYRSRALTKACDRVIAFAGIARAFTNLGDMTYLAGCWASTLR